MDILKILVDNLADGGVAGDEIGKAQAPWAPVATYLTNDELTFGLGFDKRLVYLFKGVDVLVIYLLQHSLGINGSNQQ